MRSCLDSAFGGRRCGHDHAGNARQHLMNVQNPDRFFCESVKFPLLGILATNIFLLLLNMPPAYEATLIESYSEFPMTPQVPATPRY